LGNQSDDLLLNGCPTGQLERTLRDRFERSDCRGWDPYDALNIGIPWTRRLDRPRLLLLTHVVRISPVNLRPTLRIVKSYNSKAMALILSALMIWEDLDKGVDWNDIEFVKNWVLDNRSGTYPEYSLGFTFDIVLQNYRSSKGAPSLIITLFAVYALMAYYKRTKETRVLEEILSFKRLVETRLPCHENEETVWYSYNFEKTNEIYNATAKVGKFYALLHDMISSDELRGRIERILQYLLKKQRPDGSWPYGETIRYTDGFHTAFVLEAIWHMLKVVDGHEYEEMFERGLQHYKAYLFKANGQPLYFHPMYKPRDVRRFLIETDIRDCAMAIVLFAKIGDVERARQVLDWTLKHMYDQKRGYFYYYKNRVWTNKIEFIRWQAWMLYALARLKEAGGSHRA